MHWSRAEYASKWWRLQRRPVRQPDLQCVLKALGSMQVTSVLLEGGAKVNGAFLRAGLVDKVWLFYAPKIFGSGAPLASSEDGGATEVALRPDITLHRYDEDFAVEGYLRDPYA